MRSRAGEKMRYVNKNSRPSAVREKAACFVDNVDKSVGNQVFADFINGSGAHSYQQITLRNYF